MQSISNKPIKICIVGLGYVGLPLALEFSKKYKVLGFDVSFPRVTQLNAGKDVTNETDKEDLIASEIKFSANKSDIASYNYYIVTVPTPITKSKEPDLTPLILASETVGEALSPGDVVIYESTVYPGVTEEVCVPVLEKASGLVFNVDFFVGYSPERINPGDKNHRLKDIVKVTSGSTKRIANNIDNLYKSIIKAGTHMAPSIKVAEAAKVIENTQRDLNIALINELSIIFNKLEINTNDVLLAAGTKWNFLPFRPGLVGGHCIGVDPYYLTYKSQSIGYEPEVILAGRRLNDNMSAYIAQQLLQNLSSESSSILIMGLTFKENCPDLRNSKVVDLYKDLRNSKNNIYVYDPWVDKDSAYAEYGIEVLEKPIKNFYDCIVLAVAHQEFIRMGLLNIKKYGKKDHIVYDLKSLFPKEQVELRL